MPDGPRTWREIGRDVKIVWVGIIVAMLAWVPTQYGIEDQIDVGSIAIAPVGSIVLLVGLVLVIAGFASVVRRINNMSKTEQSVATSVLGSTPPKQFG
jgi:uncharacterized membrane protein